MSADNKPLDMVHSITDAMKKESGGMPVDPWLVALKISIMYHKEKDRAIYWETKAKEYCVRIGEGG